MPAPLLGTKVFLPRPRPGLVRRPRLSERLHAGASTRLLLVSAPAGFGKTTLLADWLADSPTHDVAWLSLDRGDNEQAAFWSGVIAALQTVEPTVGADELALLAAPRPPPIAVVLTTLLNQLALLGGETVLVLDDYHLVEAREIQEAMAFLLDHLPPRLHLVIASRADPAIPLARLRARGELVEVRAADLRFTADEVAAYLGEVMGLAVTADDVSALGERTEGWIAALQLAALSMQGRDDVTGFIAGFTGDDRYIVDYLVEEVLHRQPGPVRDFLLQTSLLGRLDGASCDAVTGRSGGRSMLEALDRGNLFVVPLDDRRQWYRYHHLFGDVLRARLVDESPDLVPVLHRRASEWYAANGETALAVEHAIAGGDVDRAADLVELAMPALARERQEVLARHWLSQLPEQVLAVRPVLSNAYAGVLLTTGQVDEVDRHLRNAERGLEDPTGTVVASETGLRVLPTGIAVHRAGLGLVTGDPASTVGHAQRALDLLADDQHIGRAAAHGLIGLATWSGGDLAAARTAYAESLDHMHRAGHLGDVLGLSIALADIQLTQGHLREARRTFEAGLRLSPPDGPALRGTADMLVGLSAVHRERGDLAEATGLLARSQELGEHNPLPQNPYRWRVAMSRIREAEGSLDEAEALLDEAERVYVGDFSPEVRPVAATRARLWIRQGRVDDALGWAREAGLAVDDELDYLREHEHVTLARALLAHEERDAAAGLLQRLLEAADAGGRTGTVMEVLVLQALVLRADPSRALVPLERALTLAEPEGYVRLFLDEGGPMEQLLEAAAKRDVAPSYARRLLGLLGSRDRPAQPGLVDPLSRRELDVLRLLATDLGGPEIAQHLVVSLNTVRTHTKSIYAKLGVTSRRAAVRRGEELDLMGRPASR